MKAKPVGHPLMLKMSPKAKMAVFLYSAGVAMGKATITAKQSRTLRSM